MSILLPALNRVRELGKRVDCLSNLRQLTLAWTMYAGDNDGKLCSPNTGRNDGPFGVNYNWVADGAALDNNWQGGTELAIKEGVLWPYTQSTELYECKSSKIYLTVNAHTDRIRDYSISRNMGYPYNFWDYKDGDIAPCRSFKTLSQTSSVSEKLVFIEADGGLRAGNVFFLFNCFWAIEIDPVTSEVQWRFSRSPGSPGIPGNIITPRHSNGCNLSFADGHCSYWKYKDSRTVKLAKDEISETDASDANPDLEYMAKILKGPK
jgi:prepilin-type processing-associated H-X9-DG protein